jgi:uncharacterized caspase-like protein
MSDEVVILQVFNNEVDARMAQDALQKAGVNAYVFKDDGGGMEPHLQQTLGVRLVARRAQAELARQVLGTRLNSK